MFAPAYAEDSILHELVRLPLQFHTVNAHTRWHGRAITEANCHPVDNKVINGTPATSDHPHLPERRHRQLPGTQRDVPSAAANRSMRGHHRHQDHPLQIEHYLRQGFEIAEAFRRAVSDFKAPTRSPCTPTWPGKLFLAQKGSGQAIFVGIAPDHYMSTSEVYGFIEETRIISSSTGSQSWKAQRQTQGRSLSWTKRRAAGGRASCPCTTTEPPAPERRQFQAHRPHLADIDRQDYPTIF